MSNTDTAKRKTPWIDRNELIEDIRKFASKNGAAFEQYSDRMSDLFEMSVYNALITDYEVCGYTVQPMNLMKNGTFKYKLSPAGLSINFSYFEVTSSQDQTFEVHHNIKIQSFHDEHIYYTGDISVTPKDGIVTGKSKSKQHSYIPNLKLTTFFEVKNMNPFPEIVFSFNGILLEIFPGLITGEKKTENNKGSHIAPAIVFSGVGSEHTEKVISKVTQRYGHNVFCGLFSSKGRNYFGINVKKIDA